MKSLHTRLLVATTLAIFLFWCGWGVFMSWWTWRDEHGFADASLRETAELVLRSLPEDFGLASTSPNYPPAPPQGDSDIIMGLAFEVWFDGRSVIRSPNAPALPAPGAERQGFGIERLSQAPYRSYVAQNAKRNIQVRTMHGQDSWQRATWDSIQFGLMNALLLLFPLLLTVRRVVHWSFKPVAALCANLQGKPALDLSPLPLSGLPTELRLLVEAFNRMIEKLRRAVEQERRFIADAAHELRTPLAALAAQAHVARHADSAQAKDAALLQLSAGVERSARLSEQLLALAKLDAAADAQRHAVVNLGELAALVVQDFEYLARQNAQRIGLRLDPAMVWGDIDELGILLRNLLDNALRFSGWGGRVDCSLRIDADRPGWVCLAVADDGPGVPEDQRERIFERFYRAPGNGQGGSGIGLSLVARIAQLHEARIELGPGLGGRGLCVEVWLPEWLDPDSTA